MDEDSEKALDEVLQSFLAPEPVTAAGLLERIDVEQLTAELESKRLLQAPYPFVLDTEFFFSAFQSQLKHGGAPKSLQIAMQGVIRFFIAADTFFELLDEKLPDFAAKLGTMVEVLEGFLIDFWFDWLTIVDRSTEYSDPRVKRLAERDASDVPAATLACLLAPCVLLTNDLDFESLIEDLESFSHVVVVKAAVQLDDASGELRVVVAVPALPVVAVAGGTRWAANRLGVSPWLVGGGLVLMLTLLGIWTYRRMDDDGKTVLRKAGAEVGTRYLEVLGKIQSRVSDARETLTKRTVLPIAPRSWEQIVLRELAMADEPLSAQRLWERLDPDFRPGVSEVREILRSHPSTVGYGRGLWRVGSSVAEALGLD